LVPAGDFSPSHFDPGLKNCNGPLNHHPLLPYSDKPHSTHLRPSPPHHIDIDIVAPSHPPEGRPHPTSRPNGVACLAGKTRNPSGPRTIFGSQIPTGKNHNASVNRQDGPPKPKCRRRLDPLLRNPVARHPDQQRSRGKCIAASGQTSGYLSSQFDHPDGRQRDNSIAQPPTPLPKPHHRPSLIIISSTPYREPESLVSPQGIPSFSGFRCTHHPTAKPPADQSCESVGTESQS
jgi:hypothetical protein